MVFKRAWKFMLGLMIFLVNLMIDNVSNSIWFQEVRWNEPANSVISPSKSTDRQK